MTDKIATLALKIDAEGYDDNELDALARQLQDEIAELDVEAVEQVKGGAIPEGAMAVDWALVGELAVKLAPIVIPALASVLKAWIDRHIEGSETGKFKIRIAGKDFKFVLDYSMSREEIQNGLEKAAQER